MVLIEGAAVAAGVATVLPLARIIWNRWMKKKTEAESEFVQDSPLKKSSVHEGADAGSSASISDPQTLHVDAEFILNTLSSSGGVVSGDLRNAVSMVSPEAEEANREVALLEVMRKTAKMKTPEQLRDMLFEAAENRDIVGLIAALDVANEWGLTSRDKSSGSKVTGMQRKKRLRSDASTKFVNIQRSSDGWTPLHIVVSPRMQSAISSTELKYQSLATLLLRQRGADTTIVDKKGRTAKDVAVKDEMVNRALGVAPDRVVVIAPEKDKEFVEEMDKILGL